ncbi:hypothetical protein BC830DRAFT_1166386 [Chytriomyces sp. MP71]|nr:hypothetical protein BC830DRAFT_1166386 [Chytriomyces sp. MP71]
MSHGISAIEKFLVFNTRIHAPEDVVVRSRIEGTVTFHTTQDVVLEDVQIKLECLEYRRILPEAYSVVRVIEA